MSVLSGLSAFTLTPMDAGGRVDTDHLQRLVARLAASDVASIGVLGSTGSYMYLDADQRVHAIAAACEAKGEMPILAGIGALKTADVLAHAKAAEAADALLLAPVSYLPLSDADFASLVTDVAAQTEQPICLYNNPGTTHFTMSEALVAQLTSIPSVAAVKNPVPEDVDAQLARLRAATPEGFVLGYSGDAKIAAPLAAGADAFYSVLAGTMPNLVSGLWAARHDRARLDALTTDLAPLWALFDTYGSIRVMPAIANLLGVGPLLLPKPLLPPPVEVVAALEKILDTLPEEAA